MKKSFLPLHTFAVCAALLPALAAQAQTTTTPEVLTPLEAPLAPTTGTASSTTMAMTPAQMAMDFDRLFTLRAFQGNLAEVMTGQMALDKSKNADVKMLSQMLIRDHGQANSELQTIMRAKGLPIPSTPGAMNQATADFLRRTKGKNFDMQFMAAQVEAHENTIMMYQQALAQSQDPQVRGYVTKYLPGIVGHTQMIYTIARKVNAPGMAERPMMPPASPEVMAMMPASNMSGMTGAMGTMGGTGMMNGGTGGSTTQ